MEITLLSLIASWMKENKLKLNPDKINIFVGNGKLDLRIDVFDRITFPMKEHICTLGELLHSQLLQMAALMRHAFD